MTGSLDKILDRIDRSIAERDEAERKHELRRVAKEERREERARERLEPLMQEVRRRAPSAGAALTKLLAQAEWGRVVAATRRVGPLDPNRNPFAPGYVPLPVMRVRDRPRLEARFDGELVGVDLAYCSRWIWMFGAELRLVRFWAVKFFFYVPQPIAELSSLSELATVAPWQSLDPAKDAPELAACALRLFDAIDDGSLLTRVAEELGRMVHGR